MVQGLFSFSLSLYAARKHSSLLLFFYRRRWIKIESEKQRERKKDIREKDSWKDTWKKTSSHTGHLLIVLVFSKEASFSRACWQINAILLIRCVSPLILKSFLPGVYLWALSIPLSINPFHTCQCKQWQAASELLKNRYEVSLVILCFFFVFSNYNDLQWMKLIIAIT